MRCYDQSGKNHLKHLWKNVSSSGCPVLGISVCRICGGKAVTQDLRMWRARERIRAFNESKAARL